MGMMKYAKMYTWPTCLSILNAVLQTASQTYVLAVTKTAGKLRTLIKDCPTGDTISKCKIKLSSNDSAENIGNFSKLHSQTWRADV